MNNQRSANNHTSEDINNEFKIAAVVRTHSKSSLDEKTFKESITEKKYERVVENILNDFIKYLEKYLIKYFSQSFNTPEIIKNYFSIHIGIADDGHAIGFPVVDMDNQMNMIERTIDQSFMHIIEMSVMKRNESQMIDDCPLYVSDMGCEKNIENSYTSTYSKSHTDHYPVNDHENIMEKIKSLINIDVKLTPVNELEQYTPEIEPELSKVVDAYEEKILNYNTYKIKKDSIQEEMIRRSLRAKASIYTILNTERRSELLNWLKTEARDVVPDMNSRFPDLAGLIEALGKTTDGKYNQIDPDYKLIKSTDIAPDKLTDYLILKLVTLYRDVHCDKLRKEASLYKLDPVVPPPADPYTSICSCYIGSVMNDIGKTYPLYVCSITLSNIEEFLKNVNLKHFYYESETGLPVCQIRKIDIVSGTSSGPVSDNKLM